MMVTHKPRVPWRWVVLMTLPWGFSTLVGGVNGQAITYTIKKFVDDPLLISLLTSVNLISNVLVGAPCNYMSDRLWTRWGRRRPFLITSALSTALLMLFIPFLPNIWLLILVNLLFQVVIDIGTCTEALYFEVIPQPQRGRAVSIRHVITGFAGLYFSMVLFANFDKVSTLDLAWLGLGAVRWTGEHTLYLTVAGALLLNAALYLFLVRETPVQSPVLGERFDTRKFLKNVFGDKRWYLVYLYYAVPAVAGAGTAQLAPLVMTDVFGYSKFDMACLGVPNMLITLCVFTPLFGWLSDRTPRVRMFQFGVYGSVAWAAAYWLYLHFLAPLGLPDMACANPLHGWTALNEIARHLPLGLGESLPRLAAAQHFSFAPVSGVPALPFLFATGLLGSIFTTATFVTYGALLFDLVPSNRMGTLAAGFGLIASVIGAVFMNLCGLFVKYYSRFFYPLHRQDATKYDYTAIYLFQAFFGLVACGMYWYFLRQYKKGKVIEYGKLEFQEEQREAAAGRTEPAALPA